MIELFGETEALIILVLIYHEYILENQNKSIPTYSNSICSDNAKNSRLARNSIFLVKSSIFHADAAGKEINFYSSIWHHFIHQYLNFDTSIVSMLWVCFWIYPDFFLCFVFFSNYFKISSLMRLGSKLKYLQSARQIFFLYTRQFKNYSFQSLGLMMCKWAPPYKTTFFRPK